MSNLETLCIKQETDENKIREIYKKENLYKEIQSEVEVNIDTYNCNLRDCVYLIPYLDEKPIGVYCLQAIQHNIFLCHVAIHKEHRGLTAYLASNLFLEYVKHIYPYALLMGMTPAKKIAAAKLAMKVGFQLVAIIPDGYRSGNTKEDLIITEYRVK